MEQGIRKKKSLLINPKFQWTLIGYAGGVASLILISMYGLLSYAFKYFNQIGVLASLPRDHVYFEFIQMQETTVFHALLLISVIVAVVLILGGLYISHKIAGPIYRMRKDLESMAANPTEDLKSIQFRKGDYFPELAQAFNAAVESRKGKAAPQAVKSEKAS